jgi:hypothetical protein
MMKHLSPGAVLVLATALIACLAGIRADAAEAEKPNLVYNHSFERLRDGAPDGWFHTAVRATAKTARTGQRSLVVEPGAQISSMGIASLPTLKYRVGGFFRPGDVKDCGLMVSYYDTQGETIGTEKMPVPTTGDEWISIESLVEVPFGAGGLTVGVYNDGDRPVYADDISALEWYQFRPPKTDDPPVIDGRLNDECWKGAGVGEEDWITVDGKVAKQQTRVFACYDNDHLYVGFRLYTARPHDLKSVETRDDFYVWRDESAEVFIDPGHDHASYCELEVNSNNVEYDAWSFDRSWECIWDHEVGLEDDAWICEIAIDLASFEYPNAAGEPSGRFQLPEHGVWGINFSRNDSITGESSSWPNSGRSFHNTHRYGHMMAFEPLRTDEYTAQANYRLQKLHEQLMPAEYVIRKNRDTACTATAARVDDAEAMAQAISEQMAAARGLLDTAKRFDDWVQVNNALCDAESIARCLDDQIQPLIAQNDWSRIMDRPVQMAVSISPTPVDPADGCQDWQATTELGVHLGRGDISGFSAIVDGFGDVNDVTVRADVETIGQLPVQIIQAPPGAPAHESYRWPAPKIDLQAGQRIVVWVPVQTGDEIPAGAYEGILKVTAQGQPPLKQPFTVHVWDFEIPRSETLKLSVISPDFTAEDISAELAGYGVPAGSVAVWKAPQPASGDGYSDEELDEIVADAKAACRQFAQMRPELSGYILGVQHPRAELTAEYAGLYNRLEDELGEWSITQIVNGTPEGLAALDPWVDIWALSASAWEECELGRDEADERWLYYELPAAEKACANRLSDARIQPWVARYIEADGIVWGGATKTTPFPMFEMYCRMIALGHRDCDYFDYLNTLLREGLRDKAGNHWRLRSNARMALLLRGFSVLTPTEYDADYQEMRQRHIRCGKLIERVRRHLRPLERDSGLR